MGTAFFNSPTTMDEVAKIDLAPWGYAPGSGQFYCSTCQGEPYPTGNWPHYGHKHSTRCLNHAMEARLKDIRASEGHREPADPGDLPLTALDRVHDCLWGVVLAAIFGSIVTLLILLWNASPN